MDPTRTVSIWLANDEGLYLGARESIHDADSARAYVEDVVAGEMPAGLGRDLMTEALDAVDWDDIAEEFAEVNAEEEDDDDE